ncbi:MAG: Branched-chain-amino-acid aminotransferase [Phycisphaerae bacterium]|nr:Branched-chain-amino-acid aminotransferase [Phycisphaerae bacterium]
MTRYVHLNGELLPADAAKVSVFDGGFLHGAGLFETMRAEGGRIFRLDAHLNRLARSAETLSLPIPRSALPGTEAFEELLARNGLREARVRLTATPGAVLPVYAQRPDPDDGPEADPSPPAGTGSRSLSAAPADATPAPTICIVADELRPHPPEAYRHGVPVMISRRPQIASDPLTAHKTICYLPRLAALQQARLARCAETLFFDESNHLAEGAISNVFIVRDGRLRTPSLSTPVLPGVARRVVLELAAALGMPADDAEPITINDLLDADEVFLTSVVARVLPVVRVERKTIAQGAPGPVTTRLLAAFRDLIASECKA